MTVIIIVIIITFTFFSLLINIYSETLPVYKLNIYKHKILSWSYILKLESAIIVLIVHLFS